jgi:hypothetical protein
MKGVFMQCPNCDHDAPDVEFGNPLRCPSCGAFYEKALIAKQSRVARATEKAKSNKQEQVEQQARIALETGLAALAERKKQAEQQDRIVLEAGFDSSKSLSKEDKQRQAQQSKDASDAARSVIVTDIQMPFWSMVRFMVKSTLAAIPALIILGVFALIVMTLFSQRQ